MGENASLNRIKILVYSINRKELHAHRCKKYPRACPSTGTKSYEFFFFTVVFLQPFTLFFSFFFLFFSFFSLFYVCPPFFSFFVLYTMVFTPFSPSTCGSGVGSPFSLHPLPLLEPSILSCKAACSLFRHHLHINAARELVGQHLMQGQQYFQIFVFSHSYPFIWYFLIPFVARFVRDVTLRDG